MGITAGGQAADGNLYGTTISGGGYGDPECFDFNCGTVFKTTLTGTLSTLYSFCAQYGCTDGFEPRAGLVQATDGNFYGATAYGGASDNGTVFKITPQGTLTTLHSFDVSDGDYPLGSPVQITSGILLGTASEGGNNSGCPSQLFGCGTIFSISMGLGSFVEMLPVAATVGKRVGILGNSLTGATSVTFNGTVATFTVVSPSLITTAVPAGATTGTVQVVTPGGTLSSNVPFHVIQ